MKTLETCCCFPVRTGTTILATIGIVISCLSIVFNIVGYTKAPNKITTVKTKIEFYYNQTGELSEDEMNQMLRGYEKLTNGVSLVLGLGTFITAVFLLINLVLLVGVRKRRPNYFLPWLVVNAIGLALSCLGVAGGAAATFVMTSTISGAHGGWVIGLIVLAVGIPVCLVLFYFWLVVHSEFRNVKVGEEEPTAAALSVKQAIYT